MTPATMGSLDGICLAEPAFRRQRDKHDALSCFRNPRCKNAPPDMAAGALPRHGIDEKPESADDEET